MPSSLRLALNPEPRDVQANTSLKAKIDILRSNLVEARKDGAAAEQLRAELAAARLQLEERPQPQPGGGAEDGMAAEGAVDGWVGDVSTTGAVPSQFFPAHLLRMIF